MTGPRHGLRVFDLTRILAKPTCAQLLGDLGGPAQGALQALARGRRQTPAELEDVAPRVEPLGVRTGEGHLEPPAGHDAQARHRKTQLVRLGEGAASLAGQGYSWRFSTRTPQAQTRPGISARSYSAGS